MEDKKYKIDPSCTYKHDAFENGTDEDKMQAFYAITHLETVNHVTKRLLLAALKWVWDEYFTLVSEKVKK